MSVIFETLQRLRHSSAEGDIRASGARRGGSVYSFKRLPFSVPGILTVCLLFILSVLFAVYGIRYVKTTLLGSEKRPDLSRGTPEYLKGKEIGDHGDFVKDDHARPSKVPPAPPHKPIEEARPGRLYIPPAHEPKTRYLPPSSRMGVNQTNMGRTTPLVPNESPGISGHYLSPAESFGETSRKVKEEVSETEKIRLANVAKSARIARLVSKVQAAMFANDGPRVKELLGQLSSLKGKEDPYVIKLKAYWYLVRGDYQSAMPLLSSFLQTHENDLEAGINMAIIEIKTRRFNEARTRLKRLRDIYQDNALIPGLMKKLEKR